MKKTENDRSIDSPAASKRPVLCTLALILFLCAPALSAQYARFGQEEIVPDNSAARIYAEEVIFTPVREIPLTEREFLVPYPGAPEYIYRTEIQNGHLYQLFLNEHDGRFPVYGAGSYIVKRSLEDGRFVQVKVFLRSDEGFFARIFPVGSRSGMNLFINGKQLYNDIPVPLRFEELLLSPFQEVVKATRHLVDWSLLRPTGTNANYRAVQQMVAKAREALPSLPDAEDGAMDESGGLVYIESLGGMEELPGFNCSGFAKWVCDGIYRTHRDSFMPIEPLKEKHLGYRGTGWTTPREDDRDPYFGLDWTRNLARTLEAAERGVLPEVIGPEAMDVRSVPLSNYVEDMGYPVGDLRHVLYYLAVKDPGTFYLGSVNREFGSAPVLRQHTHVVVLFPYFAETGAFEIAVLERNVETSLDSLEERYGGDYLHLVRVAATEAFEPPVFDN